jgi:hypothetical protein
LVDVTDIDVRNGLDGTVYSFLKEKYKVKEISKRPVLEKYDILMRLAKVIFLIRHKEETRGGEYMELMHTLSRVILRRFGSLRKTVYSYQACSWNTLTNLKSQ